MTIEWILSACVGVGLAACCGFRVFVPLLIAGIATRLGFLHPDGDFSWISSWPALLGLGVATVLEFVAYYIPWLDNALDAIATPAAVMAGTLLSTSFFNIDTPLLSWGLGLMLGGGSAGLIQAGTSLLRLGSTATTGGLGNPVVATGENVASVRFSLLAIFMPLVGVIVLGLIVLYFVSRIVKKGAKG